jgi:hypothetical protein
MLINALAQLVAKIPSPVKYRMGNLRPIYTSLMRLGGSAVRVETAAGPLNWKIDSLTSQQNVLGLSDHPKPANGYHLKTGQRE